ncbi:glycosyltransferase family 4 protein [Clostridium coskatii]|uniref:Spore coat protein SA n=1 Tax=Clostridium coskatii TaxID=1705578 RepID=A0A170NNX6_9CLOT|nr:glycosyltransferase [Clostridium coskatii]OAA94201.1 Spore coat protein SA [Clostridium coskatii]OBR95529.1 spore coat protein SA [Clostridium coskatii]
MKVLWLCNIPLPDVSKALGVPEINLGGWLVGLSNDLKAQDDVELSISFLLKNINYIKKIKANNINYYAVPQETKSLDKYDMLLKSKFGKLLDMVKPDLVHIWGTEYPHALSMASICKKKFIKTVISIQGICKINSSVYHYFASLPFRVRVGFTLRDLIRKDNLLLSQRRNFNKGIKFETEILKKASFIIGRTSMDKAYISQVNPKARYYFCNETLRDEFYKHEWNVNNCIRHSIFISQAIVPLKGLHFMLEAMPKIIKVYSDVKLYVAGKDVTRSNGSFKEKMKITYYGKYIKELIKKHNLKNHVIFTGNLDEKQMCNKFLKSNVFVCSSSIENSPNSLGEAMLLGVPCVSSDVGGVKDMLEHNKEGYIYQHDAPYMLAYYICKIFKDDKLAYYFSKNARQHAKKTHSKEENLMTMLNIYKEIINE